MLTLEPELKISEFPFKIRLYIVNKCVTFVMYSKGNITLNTPTVKTSASENKERNKDTFQQQLVHISSVDPEVCIDKDPILK